MTTPFELRFKLLEMAQRYFEFVDARTRDFTDEAWSHAKEQGDATLEYWENPQPKPYSIEDIKTKAKELYEFVEKH